MEIKNSLRGNRRQIYGGNSLKECGRETKWHYTRLRLEKLLDFWMHTALESHNSRIRGIVYGMNVFGSLKTY